MPQPVVFSTKNLNLTIAEFNQAAVNSFLDSVNRCIQNFHESSSIEELRSRVSSIPKNDYIKIACLLEKGKLFLQLASMVGKGFEHVVYLGLVLTSKSASVVATKSVSEEYFNWISHALKLGGKPYIVPIYEAIQITGLKRRLLCEKLADKDLFDFLMREEKIEFNRQKSLTEKAIGIVRFLSEKNLYHKDLRHENILVCGEDLYLTDPSIDEIHMPVLSRISPEAAAVFLRSGLQQGFKFIKDNNRSELMWNLGLLISFILIHRGLTCLYFTRTQYSEQNRIDFANINQDLIDGEINLKWRGNETFNSPFIDSAFKVMSNCLRVRGQERTWPDDLELWTLTKKEDPAFLDKAI